MPGWGVIPSIRVRDMKQSLDFYQSRLGFNVARGGPDDDNVSMDRGDAHIMLEVPTVFYSPGYNDAIRQRIGSPSPGSLYIEAGDLDELHDSLTAAGTPIIDPLAERPWGQREFTVADPDGNWLTFWKALAQ